MIDNSLNIPIYHSAYFENDNKYLTILNKEIDRLIESSDNCWGRLDTDNDTWASFAINKDILFNNKIFDAISNKLKDSILQYAMALRVNTLQHQIHLMDSSIYVSKSNPKKQFKSDNSQHFIGYLFLKADDSAGNIIIKNPIAPNNMFRHTGESPLREYYIKEINTGDLMILPSHIEHKMTDFDEKNELRMVIFGISVA